MACAWRVKLAHLLPPAFILSVIGIVDSVYIGLHILPLLQPGVPSAYRDQGAHNLGIFELAFSQAVAFLLLTCYALAVAVRPGSVPDSPEWLSDTPDATGAIGLREFKLSGQRRHCKWCQKYKPDRTHHCRVCETCVLKMDHHCPWIMNCVGFRNHKYFLLLVVYTVIDCFFITGTMAATVAHASSEETPPWTRFWLVLGMTFGMIMGLAMGTLLVFHLWLMSRGMTTIEFCEKAATQSLGTPQKLASYDRGLRANIDAVLGPRPLLWMLPFSPPEGDGLNWKVAPSRRLRESLRTSGF